MFSAFLNLFDNAQKRIEEITTEIQKSDGRGDDQKPPPDLLSVKRTSTDLSETISPALDNFKKTTSLSINPKDFGLPFFGENTPQLEPWMYRENFAAGSGMLTKYTLYLNKIGQNNRILSQKANACGQALSTTFLDAAKSQNEWRQVQSIISELPNMNLQLNLLQKKVEAIVFKVEEIEKKLDEEVKVTVSCQLSLWKYIKENEIMEQHEKCRKDLVVLEQRFSKIAKGLEEEEKKKKAQQESEEKEMQRKKLAQDIDKQLQEYAIYGPISTTTKKTQGPSVSLEGVVLEGLEDYDLDNFLGGVEEIGEKLEIEKDDERKIDILDDEEP